MKELKYGKAICYSGYRNGQSPIKKIYPTYKQIKEDLLILENDFDYIRMYDPSKHAEITLEVIEKEKINLKVMLGIDLAGEISNPQCAWGGVYSAEQITKNIEHNESQLKRLIKLANRYPNIIVSVSAGNEAVPEWNENLVSPKRVLYFVKELKKNTKQIVTYCENINYWDNLLVDVAKEVDIISIHTYPIWVGHSIKDALNVSVDEYNRIKNTYPNKQCIITETGWTTNSSRDILPENANEENQKIFIEQMQKWSEANEITIFFFEAFDEPWKGNNDPNEPEKHWGIYYENRKPKLIYQK